MPKLFLGFSQAASATSMDREHKWFYFTLVSHWGCYASQWALFALVILLLTAMPLMLDTSAVNTQYVKEAWLWKVTDTYAQSVLVPSIRWKAEAPDITDHSCKYCWRCWSPHTKSCTGSGSGTERQFLSYLKPWRAVFPATALWGSGTFSQVDLK